MRWHVVRSLSRVSKPRIAVRHQIAHESLEIVQHSRICVLIHHQRSTGVTNEQMAQSISDIAAVNYGSDVLRDVEAAAALGLDDQLFLKDQNSPCNTIIAMPPERLHRLRNVLTRRQSASSRCSLPKQFDRIIAERFQARGHSYFELTDDGALQSDPLPTPLSRIQPTPRERTFARGK